MEAWTWNCIFIFMTDDMLDCYMQRSAEVCRCYICEMRS